MGGLVSCWQATECNAFLNTWKLMCQETVKRARTHLLGVYGLKETALRDFQNPDFKHEVRRAAQRTARSTQHGAARSGTARHAASQAAIAQQRSDTRACAHATVTQRCRLWRAHALPRTLR